MATLPKEPMICLDTGMHISIIRRIATDTANRYFVTASDDKTLRVWSLSDGRLLQTIRVPIGPGNLGKLYSVALSPDGQTVAAGGWTAVSGTHIYLFDRRTGELRQRLTGLPNVVNHLTYSPDGTYLIATMGVSNGIRVWSTSEYKLLPSNDDYGSDIYWAAFDSANRLVTTCWDGYIRLYEPDSYKSPIAKVKSPDGQQPFLAAFSPDSNQIAVGYFDSTRVDVLSADNLEHTFSPDTGDVNNGNLASVAWSVDGRSLYAGGQYSNSKDQYLIRCWKKSGRGKPADFPVTKNTIMDLLPLTDGGLAFGAADPAFGIINKAGKTVYMHSPVIADFRDQQDNFQVSFDGNTVAFDYKGWGEQPASFSVSDRHLKLAPADEQPLDPAITDSPGLKVEDWKETYTPKLKGRKKDKPLALDEYETSRSLAIAPDGKLFLLGTEWSLRCFERKGTQKWVAEVPSVAWSVNVSGDGRLGLAAFGDGTIRWYRLEDGTELLALFPHNDGKRWIAWTPEGYYAASAGAEDLIGWHVNRGFDRAPDFYPASRFRERFSRPDVITRVLKTLDVAEALKEANAANDRETVATELRSILPPDVKILAPTDEEEVKRSEVTLTYLAESRAGPVTIGKLTIPIPAQDAAVSVIAENEHSASEPATIRLVWSGQKDWYKANLYVLAIGVSTYVVKNLNLEFAAKDAQDFAKTIKAQEGGLYKSITIKELTNKQVTVNSIKDGLDWIEKETTSRDVAMVFLAGHGVKGPRSRYWFLPHDADIAKLKVTAVSGPDIVDFLRAVAGKTLFFVDTCHSGDILDGVRADSQPDVDQLANELASAENGVIVYTSSTGNQFSRENKDWQNGAFTKALVEGLAGKADYTGDKTITVNELDVYLSDRVKKLTKGQQKPTSAKPKTIENLTIAQIP
jgi:WD40 repeat protein